MRVVIAPFNRMNDATLAGVRAAGHEVLCTGTESLSYWEIAAQYPEGWQPDVFLFWSPEYHPIPRDLESAPCLKVGVFGDWNLGGQAVQQAASMFDLLFADSNGADRLRALGFQNVASAPLWSFDPDLHRRIPDIERDIDILLVGNFNHEIQRERSRWLGRIARLSSRYRVLLTAGVYGEEYARLLNRARIVFNRSIRGEINMRTYEAPACGALLFYERENREIDTLFADRRECVLYSEEDLELLLDHYLSHEFERAAIADAGYRRVQRETPSQHIVEMFRVIGSELAARPVRRVPAYWTLPQAVAEIRRARQWLLSSDIGCLGEAGAALDRAELVGGDTAELAGLRGYMFAQAGQFGPEIDRAEAWSAALQQWRTAAEQKPSCASARLNLASILIETGHATEAELQARTALNLLSSTDADAIAPGALYWPLRFAAFGVEYDRIEISHIQGSPRWFAALRALLRWRACELLADLTFTAERFAASAEYAEMAAAIMPHIAATQYRKGRALNALGRMEDAVAGYRAALAVNPFLAEARRALAEALVDISLSADALAEIEDWEAVIGGCPAYRSQLPDCGRLRTLAENRLRATARESDSVRRILAFPNWRRAESWQDLVARFACGQGAERSSRGNLLMLWADASVYDPAALLNQVAAYLTTNLRLAPTLFPNLTIVCQSLAAHERWKLFRAANAVLDAGPIPEPFQDVFEASSLPVLSFQDARSLAA